MTHSPLLPPLIMQPACFVTPAPKAGKIARSLRSPFFAPNGRRGLRLRRGRRPAKNIISGCCCCSCSASLPHPRSPRLRGHRDHESHIPNLLNDTSLDKRWYLAIPSSWIGIFVRGLGFSDPMPHLSSRLNMESARRQDCYCLRHSARSSVASCALLVASPQLPNLG